MKLVSIHKHFFLVIALIGGIQMTHAQIWSLQTCIDTAKVLNKSLEIGRNNIEISTERHDEASSNLIPKVNVDASYKYFTDLPYQLLPLSVFGGPDGQFKEAQFGVPHNINVTGSLVVPIYNPQVYGAIQSTSVAEEIAELSYRKTEEQLFFEISNLYYNLQILDHQLAFIDSNFLNASRLLDNMRLLESQQMARATDVGKVQLQCDQLLTQKTILTNKQQQVLNYLKLLIGVPAETNLQIDYTIAFESRADYNLNATIDYRLVQTQNKLLTIELSTLKRTRIPSLSFFASYGVTGFGYDKKPNDFLNFYPIGFAGIQLNYPLFNGMITTHKISQKSLELKNNSLQLSLISEQSNVQSENARLQKKSAEQIISMTLKQIETAKEVYRQTIFQLKEQSATLTDVLLADNAVREAQQSYLNAIIDYFKADLELKKVSGNFNAASN